MKTFNSVKSLCQHFGLNDSDFINAETTAIYGPNDDSCHDIKEYIAYGYEQFKVSGLVFIKGKIEVPRPVCMLGSFSVFDHRETT